MTLPIPIATTQQAVMSPRRFALLAGELLLISTLLGCLAVYLATSTRPMQGAEAWHIFIGASQAVVLVLAAASAARIAPAVRNRKRVAAMTLAGVTIMYGSAAAGLQFVHVLLQIPQATIISIPSGPKRTPPAAPAATSASTSIEAQAPVSAADLPAGKRAYVASCAGCHGVSGEGLPGVAPALRGSELFRSGTEQSIARLIIEGIPVNSPENKTGKVMPPRGGNPFLSDPDVMNIIAFLRDGEASGDAVTSEATPATAAPRADDEAADPRAMLPRWVVPAPPASEPVLAAAFAAPLPPPTAPSGASTFRLVFSVVLIGHLLVGLVLTGRLMWHAHVEPLNQDGVARARFLTLYWSSAVIVWLVQMPLAFV